MYISTDTLLFYFFKLMVTPGIHAKHHKSPCKAVKAPPNTKNTQKNNFRH